MPVSVAQSLPSVNESLSLTFRPLEMRLIHLGVSPRDTPSGLECIMLAFTECQVQQPP